MDAVLKQRYRMMPRRVAAFVDVLAGLFLHEDGTLIDFGEPVELADVLGLMASDGWGKDAPDLLYIVGGWNAASTPKSEWFAAPEGWERGAYHRGPLIAVYKPGSGVVGRKITIYASAQWFGQACDIRLVREAYRRLEILVRGNFGNEAFLLGTPARSGLDLIERSLPTNRDKKPYEWPVLDVSVRQAIERNIGQGRMEMLRQGPLTPATDKLYIEDAIWMYAACCRRLPTGPVEHDSKPDFADWRRAFYRVEYQVPPGWQHIGLLPTWNPKDRRGVWPSRPSTYWYESYCCAEELRLALEQNWPVKICERWLFASGDGVAVDPLRNWISKLREMRARVDEDRDGDDVAPLLRGAIRSLCIKAIGGLHRKGRYQIVETPLSKLSEVVEDAEVIWRTDSHVRWRRPIPLDRHMEQFAHPEWSAYVWGRARARLARAALSLPRECIIALRSDAIALTFDPGWSGSQPGEFRLKRVIDLAGRRLPATTREYLDLLQDEDEE